MIEGGSAAEGYGRGVSDRAELEGVSDGIVSEEGEDVGGKIQHHQVGGILFSEPAQR